METTSDYRPTLRPSPKSWRGQQEALTEAEALAPNLFYTALRQYGAQARMISFCLRSESRHALPTGELEEICFQPETGITLFFRFAKVTLIGRNLAELYDKLCEGRITMIRDYCEESAAFFDEQGLFINQIRYESDNLDRQA